MDLELRKELDRFADSERENILRDIGRLVAINSVEGESAPDAPFGPGPKAALALGLQIAEELASIQAGRTVHFLSVRNLKFRQPVTPDDEVTISIHNGKIEIDPYMCAHTDLQ